MKSVSMWENGKATPREKSIMALAKALEFPREFFFGEVPPLLDYVEFRSLARMTARERDRAKSAGSLAIMLDRLIESEYTRPASRVPDLRDSTPEAAADTLRAEWGLGYAPIRNLVHIMEKNGIRVYSLAYDNPAIDAFSHWDVDKPFVFLNTTKTAERVRMDAAHELGHLVLHPHARKNSRDAEREAQRFASAFLMPKPQFIASAPRNPSLLNIVEAKGRWGVSALAYVYRLNALGLIRDWHYQHLCIQIKGTYGTQEPGPERPREASQVLGKVIGGSGLSRRDIANRLHIGPRDLDEITFGLALTPLSGGGQTTHPAASPGNPIRLVK